MKIIRIFKVFLALGFLFVAYAFTTDSKLLGIPAEIVLMAISLLAFMVVFLEFRIRKRR